LTEAQKNIMYDVWHVKILWNLKIYVKFGKLFAHTEKDFFLEFLNNDCDNKWIESAERGRVTFINFFSINKKTVQF